MTKTELKSDMRVAIIGAGFSGIAAAISLKRAGITNFTILESAPELGGTWYYNRYPGAEVDLESHIYSFSYEQFDWSRTHAAWDEILAYLNHVADKWGLRDHMRFNEFVTAARWDDATSTYALETSSGKNYGNFDSVVSCVGFLNVPLIPPFARGEHAFKGPVCHTSRWVEGLSMDGKKVGVLGVGSSGVQIVSAAQPVAEKVTIFQIEPNWIIPKEARNFTEEERENYRNPDVYFADRQALYDRYDAMQMDSSHARRDGVVNQERAARALEFMHSELEGRPDLIELVTPEFGFESRRTVNSDDYYRAIRNDNVKIVPVGAKEFSEVGIIDANGDEHELDMVVLATGFDAANYLGQLKVTGKDGRDLHEFWDGEPAALLGMMVPGFPNFFMLYGPNTNSIPLVTFYEAQADFLASVLVEMEERGAATVEVTEDEFEKFNSWVQERLGLTVWKEVVNYFQSKTGKVVSQWPDSPSKYIEMVTKAKETALTFEGERVKS